jgi:hypothetical protein
MTKTDTQLADLGHAAQRRAALYHVLLREFVSDYESAHPAHCNYCDSWHKPGVTRHDSNCLIERIERALDADNDTVRAMLAEVNT